jgi:hypothetical protein
MRSRALTELPSLIGESESIFIVAPNYEPRSVLGMPDLISVLKSLNGKVRGNVWTLQADQNRVEPLEYLKKMNVGEVWKLLGGAPGITAKQETIPYPEGGVESYIVSVLGAATQPWSEEACLIIDISTFPRKMIVAILKAAFGLIRGARIGRLFLLYAWAQGYPRAPYAAEEGGLKIMETGRRLNDEIRAGTNVYCTIFCGRQGFDAKQLMEALPPNAETQIYVLINRLDLTSSLHMLRSNSTVISSGGSRTINFYLSMQSAHEMMMERANRYQPGAHDLFLVAPFGPKPLTVATFCSLERIRSKMQHNIECEVGTVALTGHQYNTTYSLGFSRWEVFELDIGDLPVKEQR